MNSVTSNLTGYIVSNAVVLYIALVTVNYTPINAIIQPINKYSCTPM